MEVRCSLFRPASSKMPKPNHKLDKKDQHLLFELDRNSRQSINDLARQTQLSREVVAYRMKRLEQKGIIQKYITIIDFSKFLNYIIRLYLKLQNTTAELEEEMAQFFVQQSPTLTVYKTDGEQQLAVGFLVKDLSRFQNTLDEFLKKYRRYVTSKNISTFLDYVHYHRNYLVEKKLRDYSAISTGSFTPYSYDEKDLQLLNLIKENSRITLLELARQLGMTSTGVKYKLRQLEKNKVIVAYKLLLNTRLLGYEYYKVDLELEEMSIIPSLNQFIVQHPNIIYRNIAVGGSDFEFDGEFKSPAEFYQFLDELRALFPGKIRRYFYYKALKIYTYSYFPDRTFI